MHSSYKKEQLLFENWRKYLNEEETLEEETLEEEEVTGGTSVKPKADKAKARAPSMVPVQPATGGLSDLPRLKTPPVIPTEKGEESVAVNIPRHKQKTIKKGKPARKMSDIISGIAQGEKVPGQEKIDKRLADIPRPEVPQARTNESRLENITIKELNELFNKG